MDGLFAPHTDPNPLCLEKDSGPFEIEGRRALLALHMDQLPETAKIIKSLIAPARHSDGPTLYMVCEAGECGQCDVYEQLPDGNCLLWPESPLPGRCQAEAAIYAGKWE